MRRDLLRRRGVWSPSTRSSASPHARAVLQLWQVCAYVAPSPDAPLAARCCVARRRLLPSVLPLCIARGCRHSSAWGSSLHPMRSGGPTADLVNRPSLPAQRLSNHALRALSLSWWCASPLMALAPRRRGQAAHAQRLARALMPASSSGPAARSEASSLRRSVWPGAGLPEPDRSSLGPRAATRSSHSPVWRSSCRCPWPRC